MRTFSEFFGFKNEPFKRAPDISFYFRNRMYEEVLESLASLLDSSSVFTLLTGAQGTGKTITLKKFISDLPSKVRVAYVSFPNLSFEDFLSIVLSEFGTPVDSADRDVLIESLGEFTADVKREERQAVIIVDDAQNLPYETLAGIFQLPHSKGVDGDSLKIIIAGRTGLEAKLRSEELKGVCGDISAELVLHNIGEQEIKEYINARIAKAGRSQIKINNNVVKKVARITKGNPQLINSLMERAIIAAFLDNSHTITDQHLTGAISSVNTIMTEIKKKRSRKYFYAAAAACCAGVLAAGAYFNLDKMTTREPVQIAVADTELPKAKPETPVQVPVVPVQPEPTPMPEPTPEPMPMPEPAPTPVPEPTPEPVPTPEPTPEPVPVPELPPVSPPALVPPPKPLTDDSVIPVGTIMIVTSTSLNIRSMPDLASDRLGAVYSGDRLTVVEDTPEWIRIEVRPGTYGWVYKRYLRVQ